jgi:hypothetical protein
MLLENGNGINSAPSAAQRALISSPVPLMITTRKPFETRYATWPFMKCAQKEEEIPKRIVGMQASCRFE